MRSIVVILLSLATVTSTQSQEYILDGFEKPYVEIQDYESVLMLSGNNYSPGRKFALNFDFPYFDQVYDSIFISSIGTISFNNEGFWEMLLMNLCFELDSPLFPDNITSDWRFKHGTQDGRQFFVLQMTKTRFCTDYSVDEYDSHINMQYWFWDDGTIEVCFGPSILDNSPVYNPGGSWYQFVNDGDTSRYSMELWISSPENNLDVLYGFNDLDDMGNYETIRSFREGNMNWWPKDGWVYRFRRNTVSTSESTKSMIVKVYYNPYDLTLHIKNPELESLEFLHVYNALGQKTLSKNLEVAHSQSIDFSVLGSGIYYYNVVDRKGLQVMVGKVFVP